MRNKHFHKVLCAGVLAAMMSCHGFAANYTENGAGTITYNETAKTYTVSYTGAAANTEYTIMVVKGSKTGNSYQYSVTSDALLYMEQSISDADGAIQFTFLPKEVTDSVVLLGGNFADGDSPKILGMLLEAEEETPDDSGGSGSDSGTGSGSGSGSGSSSSSGSDSSEDSDPSGSDAPVTETVPSVKEEDGSFTSDISPSVGDKLVDTAKQNNGSAVIIAPDVQEDASSVTVTLPADTVSGIASETTSDVVISTPAADVVLPNDTLMDLGDTQKDLSVTVEETAPGQVAITVMSGGTPADTLSSGLIAVLPVEDPSNPGLVAVKVNPDGTEEIIVNSAVTGNGLAASLNGSAVLKVVDNSKVFIDVGSHWAKDNIQFVAARGIFGGTGSGKFSPEAGMTRGMLVTVLHTLHGRGYTGPMDAFADISATDWFAKGANWAAANHIVSGVGNGLFAPSNDVTREQTAVILFGYAKMIGLDTTGRSSLDRFHDEDQVSFWAQDAMEWAVHSGLISGTPGGLLAPQGTTTRAEMATIMRNFVQLSLN